METLLLGKKATLRQAQLNWTADDNLAGKTGRIVAVTPRQVAAVAYVPESLLITLAMFDDGRLVTVPADYLSVELAATGELL